MTELQRASAVADNPKKWTIHIAHIKLLSELLLNEHGNLEAEINDLYEQAKHKSTQASTNVPEQDDGTSIFDF